MGSGSSLVELVYLPAPVTRFGDNGGLALGTPSPGGRPTDSVSGMIHHRWTGPVPARSFSGDFSPLFQAKTEPALPPLLSPSSVSVYKSLPLQTHQLERSWGPGWFLEKPAFSCSLSEIISQLCEAPAPNSCQMFPQPLPPPPLTHAQTDTTYGRTQQTHSHPHQGRQKHTRTNIPQRQVHLYTHTLMCMYIKVGTLSKNAINHLNFYLTDKGTATFHHPQFKIFVKRESVKILVRKGQGQEPLLNVCDHRGCIVWETTMLTWWT